MKLSQIRLNTAVVVIRADYPHPSDFYMIRDVRIDDEYRVNVYCQSIYNGRYMTFNLSQIESPEFYGF